MEFLKKRSTARIVLIAVIVVFTVIGVNMSAARVVRHTEKQFYDGVYIRAGHHCAQPLMQYMGTPSTARASIMFYNTEEELGRLAESLRHVRERMGYGQ